MKPISLLSVAVATLFILACGPTSRSGNQAGDDDGSGADASNAACVAGSPEVCDDGIDNDCDGLIDCNDPDCSGVGTCPVCGMVQHPLSTPLALPDGVDTGTCTANAGGETCSGMNGCPTGDQCCEIAAGDNECRAPYTSKLNFTSFGPTQTFTAVSNIQSVCVTMEHSWMRDLEIDLRSPSGQLVALEKFGGQTGSEVYLGKANDCDDDDNPVPGVGADYCWKPTATNPNMLTFANTKPLATVQTCNAGITAQELPPGDYSAADPWTNLMGATLNGDWELVVVDLWPIDNGYIFKWSISFDPGIVTNCSGPVIQ